MVGQRPKLRLLNPRWAQLPGQPALALDDPLRLSGGTVLVPQVIAPLLGLCDGTRDLAALRVGFLLRTGISLTPNEVESFVRKLDDALLLDNERFRHALEQALQSYRSAHFRAPALAGSVYPADSAQLDDTLNGYSRQAGNDVKEPPGPVVGLISPHIDYARGWRTYHQTWRLAQEAAEEAELVIVLGTDHSGTPGTLTLTRQSYATPWGSLPTDTRLVNRLASVLGEGPAFAEESHHLGEHSIELAVVWLHFSVGRHPKRLLPLLCGPLQALPTAGEGSPGRLEQALHLLAEVAAQQPTLVVAAGDLSHIGPAFGDPMPVDLLGRARVRASDEQWLAAACSGDSDLLEQHIVRHGDSTRICGAAPIIYMLKVLPESRGQLVAYEQCPADPQFGSLVSVAGALFTV